MRLALQTTARSPHGVPVELWHDPGATDPWVLVCTRHNARKTCHTKKRASEFLREADLWCDGCHQTSYGRPLAT